MATKCNSEPTFEKALEELERLLADMENVEMPLEKSVDKYERAKYCLDVCRRKLGNAELRIKKINGETAEEFNVNAE